MKLSAIVLSLSVILFSNNAHANALPATTPQPINAPAPVNTTPTNFGGSVPTNIPAPANDPKYNMPVANDLDYGKKTSTFGKIAGNIKKIARPDIITVGVGLGTLAVDYVMNPENNRPRPKEEPQPSPVPAPQPQPAPNTRCKVYFGSPDSYRTLDELIARINSYTEYDGNPGFSYRVKSESISELRDIEKNLLNYYNNNTNFAVQAMLVSHHTIKYEFTHVETGSKSNNESYAGAIVSCAEPAQEPKEEEKEEPQPQPQPQPRPQENPQPQPQPQPRPQENPQPHPQDEYELNLEFELPQFCDWAKPVCDFIDWFKNDEIKDDDNTQIDIEPPPTLPQSVNIRFGGACPASRNIPIVFATVNANLSISYDPICRFAELIAPIVKICSTLVALYILAGIKS